MFCWHSNLCICCFTSMSLWTYRKCSSYVVIDVNLSLQWVHGNIIGSYSSLVIFLIFFECTNLICNLKIVWLPNWRAQSVQKFNFLLDLFLVTLHLLCMILIFGFIFDSLKFPRISCMTECLCFKSELTVSTLVCFRRCKVSGLKCWVVLCKKKDVCFKVVWLWSFFLKSYFSVKYAMIKCLSWWLCQGFLNFCDENFWFWWLQFVTMIDKICLTVLTGNLITGFSCVCGLSCWFSVAVDVRIFEE